LKDCSSNVVRLPFSQALLQDSRLLVEMPLHPCSLSQVSLRYCRLLAARSDTARSGSHASTLPRHSRSRSQYRQEGNRKLAKPASSSTTTLKSPSESISTILKTSPHCKAKLELSALSVVTGAVQRTSAPRLVVISSSGTQLPDNCTD